MVLFDYVCMQIRHVITTDQEPEEWRPICFMAVSKCVPSPLTKEAIGDALEDHHWWPQIETLRQNAFWLIASTYLR